MQRFINLFPLLIIPVAIYAIFAAIGGTDNNIENALINLPMPSGAIWDISGGDLLVAFGLAVFFYESIRMVPSSPYAILHHTLSVLLALSSLGVFLLFDQFATSSFFFLTLMCIFDMIAGIIANIAQSGDWD